MNYEVATIQPGLPEPYGNDIEIHEGIVILDPITLKNVSKSSFKVEEIKNAFKSGQDFFYNSFLKFNSKMENEFNNSSSNILNMFFNGHL